MPTGIGLGLSPNLPDGARGTPWTPTELSSLRAWYDAELGQPKYGGAGAYVQLDGTSGDYIYTPDTATVSFSNDIEVVMRVKVTDWSAAAIQTLVGKYVTTGNQRSWKIASNTSAQIIITVSTDGTTTNTATITPSVALPDNTWIWLRLRMDLTNGSNSVGTVETAADTGTNDEPSSWTANGTATATALAGIFDSTASLEIGSFNGGTSERLAGQVARCIVRDGFGGRTIADFDARACYGPGYLNQGSLPTDGGGARYVPIRRISGDVVWTADKPALRITGDLELVARAALDDWTPSSEQALVSKYDSTGNLRCYYLGVNPSGTLIARYSVDGITAITPVSTAALPATDGVTYWVRATIDVDNGAGGHTVRFYWAADAAAEPSSWTQLGADVVTAGTVSLFAGAVPLVVGAFGNSFAGFQAAGRFYRAIVRSGIGGTVVADFNAEQATVFGQAADGYGNGWLIADPKHLGNWTLGLPKIYDTSGNGRPPSVFGAGSNQPLWLPWQGRPQLYSPAGTNNTVSAPSLAQYNITGDIEIVARVMQVPNGAPMRVVSRATATTWGLFINASNLFGASVRIGGVHYYPSVSFGQWFGRPVWVRWTRVAATGENAFYVHPDQAAEPTNWILLGTSTTGGAGAMDSVAGLGVIVGGYAATGGEPWQGTISKVTVRNGIAGSAVADFDAGLCGQAGYSSAEGSVWTVNRATSGPKVVVQSPVAASARSVILHGTDDYIDVPAAAVPTMSATDNAAVAVAGRVWNTPVNFGRFFSSEPVVNTSLSLSVRSTFVTFLGLSDGTNTGHVNAGPTLTSGQRFVLAADVAARSASGSSLALNSDSPSIASNSSVGSIAAPTGGSVGRAFSGGSYQDCEIEAIVFKQAASTATERGLLTAYYRGGL